MSLYTRFLELSVKNYEPYFFANYLIQLANKFHILYEKEKFLDKFHSEIAPGGFGLIIVKDLTKSHKYSYKDGHSIIELVL